MRIEKIEIPVNSLLACGKYDYTDSYKGTFTDKKDEIDVIKVGKAFFNSAPKA